MKLFFAANWKMNMLQADAKAFCAEFTAGLAAARAKAPANAAVEVGIAPPFTALAAVRSAIEGSTVLLGSQNVHWLESGAHTGEISPSMLADQGVNFAVIGHSERRQFYGENDANVAKRALAAINKGIRAVVCVGESLEQFEAGKTEEVVRAQLVGSLDGFTADSAASLVIAYEPVWAIGTGKAATPEIAAGVHAFIRARLIEKFGQEVGKGITILYGGSTSPENIASLISKPDIDGALIGGASLKPQTFLALIANGSEALAERH